jgi:hypothetical protein
VNKSLENVLKALEQDALAFCSESDWAIVVAECERAGNVRRVSKSAQVILEKAMSRSEAGRFAAEQRWKNHVKEGDGSGGRIPNPPGSSVRGTRSAFKTPESKANAKKMMRDALLYGGYNGIEVAEILTGRGNNIAKKQSRRWLKLYGFTDGQIREFVGRDTVETSGSGTPKEKYSPVQYQAVRDAIPQISADNAKKLTQYLADNDLLGGTAGMTPQQMLDKWVPHLDRALGGSETATPKTAPVKSGGERGSGSFDDGTPFHGKFSSPTNNDGEGDGTLGTSRVNHPVYKTPKYKAEVKAAALYQLHNEIVKMHRQAGKQIPNSAKPYMDALNSLSNVNEMYGMDSGKSIVAYTISNIKFFGEQGKALKAELSARLK